MKGRNKSVTNDMIIEESKKYKTLKEFNNSNHCYYTLACSRNIIDDFVWLERKNNKWTEYSCIEEANRYTTLKEFRVNSPSAYSYVLRNNLINKITCFNKELKKDKYYDICYEAAKKYSYYKDFRIKEPNLFVTASFNKWLKDYTWLIKMPVGSVKEKV